MYRIPKRFRGIKRFEQVLKVLTKYELGYYLEKAGLKKKSLKLKKKKMSRPVELRLILEELGGTFIKLGQLLSLRPDLIPKAYCDELAKLQDDCKPFAYHEAEHAIKAELKKPVNKLFKKFNKKPIAAASIGQVHEATLKNNSKVAVKVMRPGISALIQTDLEIVHYLAKLFKHHIKQDIFDPEEIFEEFKRYTEDELDYLKEAHNIRMFYNDFKKDRKVKIPRVYDKLTTRKVLVMEFIKGPKLSQVIAAPGKHKKINRRKTADLIVYSVLQQVFVNGLFHADPHPANLIVRNNSSIGFIDFGIIGRIEPEMKEKMGRLFISLINRDSNSLVKSFISLNLVDSNVNVAGFRRALCGLLGKYYDVKLEKMDFAELFFKSMTIAREYNIRVSRDFVLLGKSLVTLQGIGIELYPEFNLVRESKPFVDQLVKDKSRPSQIVRRLAKETGGLAEFVRELPEESEKIYQTARKADSSLDSINADLRQLNSELRTEAGRIIIGMIIAALIIGASLTSGTTKSLSSFFVIVAAAMLVWLLYTVLRDSYRKKQEW